LDGVIQVHDHMWHRRTQSRRRSVRRAAQHRRTTQQHSGFDPVDELNVALYAISDVGRCIQSADTKSGMLGALLGLTIAGASSQLALVRTTFTSVGPLHGAAVVLLVSFAATLFAAGALLGLSQLPRLGVPQDVRRLAVPALARGVDDGWGRPGAAELRDEAWRQAEALARIAVHKFRYLRASLLCSGLCVVSFLLWLGLSSVIPT
jgi:hypothetical protein